MTPGDASFKLHRRMPFLPNGSATDLRTCWGWKGIGAPSHGRRRVMTQELIPPPPRTAAVPNLPYMPPDCNAEAECSESLICRPYMHIHIHHFTVLNH
jgi:hypothetical protein